MSIKDELSKLGDLYAITGHDWHVYIDQCLTEPTCPTVIIEPEGWRINRYRYDCSSIEEGVAKAVAHVLVEVVDRSIFGHSAPWTNPNDKAFEAWLRERVAGSDAELPRIKIK